MRWLGLPSLAACDICVVARVWINNSYTMRHQGRVFCLHPAFKKTNTPAGSIRNIPPTSLTHRLRATNPGVECVQPMSW